MKRWPVAEAQSALVVLVPGAEELVGAFRAQYDPSSAAGVPAHITLLYPFMPPAEIDESVMRRVRGSVSVHSPFDFDLSEIRQFPGTVYLAPRPEARFLSLMRSLWQAFPDHPPYEGQHADVVPHLTVGTGLKASERDQIVRALTRAGVAALPIRGRVTEIALLDNEDGPWRVVAVIPLSDM